MQNVISPSHLHMTLQEPEMSIDDATLDSWKDDRLEYTEVLLSSSFARSNFSNYHTLACRALVRIRLGELRGAATDADECIKMHKSVVGYIAKCAALVCRGDLQGGMRACDIAFEHFHSTHATTLLVIKAVVLFIAGECADAIARLDDLLDTVNVDLGFYVIQAYMHFILGRKYMKSGDHKNAIQSFERARTQLRKYEIKPILVVSLISGWKFDSLEMEVQQSLCEALYAAGQIEEAGQAIKEFTNTSADLKIRQGLTRWVDEFKLRCIQRLKELGASAIDARQSYEAISYYTAALELRPTLPQEFFAPRGSAYIESQLWEGVLEDADLVIKLDPSFPLGYEKKHAALHVAKRFDEAVNVLEIMISKLAQASDGREPSRTYVAPSKTKEAIRAVIKNVIRNLPPELINTHSGRLLNKSAQALVFESQPIFNELISSMTTTINFGLIEREVTQFYRYATFSHKWENNEPLYETVAQAVVYDLEESPTHKKLQMYCNVVREAGYYWAWSDTCCIDKRNNSVLQEALISMFKWYEGSALTVIFLLDVLNVSGWDDLTLCVWNTRGWTLQEYHASKVVQFYTRDWTRFMDLAVDNHKKCPEIISTMEIATGVSSKTLMSLRPGLDDIREKLRLASTRHTERIEDEAYSLLGIFSVSLQVAYGEGDKALGRLLAQLLMSSGDTSILAWTGTSGSFNSCLPSRISVFNDPPTSHIPLSITDNSELTASAFDSLDDMSLIMQLHDRLSELPVPLFAGQRLRLPCLTFKLGPVQIRNESDRIFRARSTVLGIVEMRSKEDLSRLGSLYVVYPWIGFLLDRHPAGGVPEHVSEDASFTPSESFDEDDLLSPPSPVSPIEKEIRSLDLISRLRRPFGALLLARPRRYVEEYKRVAAESVITVQVEELTRTILEDLVRSVRVLDVL